jgi:hypothetical protein
MYVKERGVERADPEPNEIESRGIIAVDFLFLK